MHEITIAIDDSTLTAYQRRADARGQSLNDAILEVLHTGCPSQLREHPDQAGTEMDEQGNDWFEELMTLIRSARGNSGGWRFNREEIHER